MRAAPIHSLAIEKLHDRLEVDQEIYLQAVGYDERGNAFSSLQGLFFLWRSQFPNNNKVVITDARSGNPGALNLAELLCNPTSPGLATTHQGSDHN